MFAAKYNLAMIRQLIFSYSFLLLLFSIYVSSTFFLNTKKTGSRFKEIGSVVAICSFFSLLGIYSMPGSGISSLLVGLFGVYAAALAGGQIQAILCGVVYTALGLHQIPSLNPIYLLVVAVIVGTVLDKATSLVPSLRKLLLPASLLLGLAVTIVEIPALYLATNDNLILSSGGPFHISLFLLNSLVIATLIVFLEQGITVSDQLDSLQAKRTLSIVGQTLPYLRTGLNMESASRTAHIILDITDVEAVAITDRKCILAFEGVGADHHRHGEPIITQATKDAITMGQLQIVNNKSEIGCPQPSCPLCSAVVAPLFSRGEVAGTLKLYLTERRELTQNKIDLAIQLSQLLSVQMELSEVENLERLKTDAELRALKAQINPHFLFNTLNTIASYSRTNPKEARNLLIQFSDLFRSTLQQRENYIPLHEEMELVDKYLLFEKARLGDRLEVRICIDPMALEVMVPPLILQPIIENAIQHGISQVSHRGIVDIIGRIRERTLILTVRDNGKGIPYENLSSVLKPGFTSNIKEGTGFGLYAVSERIQTTYGKEYGVDVSSIPGAHTEVRLRIPLKKYE